MDINNYLDSLKETINETYRCRNCNYCYSRCPIHDASDGFMTKGPSGITQSIYYLINWELKEDKEKQEIVEILSACTTCNACVIACKELAAGMPILDIIESGRKFLVEENIGLLENHSEVLNYIYQKKNSYGMNPTDRIRWAKDLDVKRIPQERAETLLYIGCTVSYDPEMQKIAKALIKIFNSINLDFGIAENEVCCGCITKRLGDELLFEEISEANLQLFLDSGVKRIVTISPHSYNTFTKEYKNMKNIEVLHYTQFLHAIIQSGQINLGNGINARVTYHDPCYLGRHNNIYEEPRDVIKAIPGVNFIEIEHYNRKFAFCCGGGGGGMWLKTERENRLSDIRVKQIMQTDADIVAVACPWCHTMLQESLASINSGKQILVMDIAQLVAEAMST
ncbi:MAG: (Fe-S)-binding protein [Candidatus Micrarchaeaceae archaeon]